MNNKLLEFIRELSAKDTKTLSLKALKAAEEVGELAGKTISYDGAHACQHRFVDKRAILEEVADVMLTVQSIAYHLGFDDNALEEMVKDKAMYWSELQNRDKKAKFPLPFEIHITVSNITDIERFQKYCLLLGVKAICIENQDGDGNHVFSDTMTSFVHTGNNSSAYAEMKKISNALWHKGFGIIREKIETVPWHPAAPSIEHIKPTMPPNCYFEAHMGVTATQANIKFLRDVVRDLGCSISRNKLKNNEFKILTTLRRNCGTIEDFKELATLTKSEIEKCGFSVDRLITEFSIYDTDISHDEAWIVNG